MEKLSSHLLSEFPHLVHGSFTRKGGISLPPFDSLNVGLSVGDDLSAVQHNRAAILKALQLSKMEILSQVHGKRIICVDEESEREGDGLVTAKPGTCLVIQHADCQAVLFYDPIRQVIAAAHAGWKGNVQNIYGEMVELLRRRYGTCPADLLVYISPSLGPTAAEFKNYKQEFPEEFWEFNVGNAYFDLWEIAKMQLKKSGVLEHHIEIAKICTYQDRPRWFSYRRDKVCGRNATVIGLVNSH